MGENKPVRVVAYIRVSTDEQATEGVSLDAQRARVEAFAKAQGLELVDVVVGAGESAKTLDRPGLKKALELLRGVDALLIPKLDRLTRSLRDWSILLEEHFADRVLLSAGDHVDVKSASGRLMLNILFAVAQHERETTAERTSAAAVHKVGKGEYIGGAAPFGFRLSACGRSADACRKGTAPCGAAEEMHGQLQHDDAEQLVIKTALELSSQGLSLRKVAAKLEELDFLSRNGKAFQAGQVARMLE